MNKMWVIIEAGDGSMVGGGGSLYDSPYFYVYFENSMIKRTKNPSTKPR